MNLEEPVLVYVLENSWEDWEGEMWCRMSDMSKTLKVFPNTLREIVVAMHERGIVKYRKESGEEYIMGEFPDVTWSKEDLQLLIHLYDGDYDEQSTTG